MLPLETRCAPTAVSKLRFRPCKHSHNVSVHASAASTISVACGVFRQDVVDAQARTCAGYSRYTMRNAISSGAPVSENVFCSKFYERITKYVLASREFLSDPNDVSNCVCVL